LYYKLNDYVRMSMKIGITMTFAENYDMTYSDAASLFKENGVYEYLDQGAGMFISHTYPYMANRVARRLGIPVRERHDRG